MYIRKIQDRIQIALADTRVVLISGPRQSGKTTLARSLSSDQRPFFTLDNANTLNAVQQDPIGFIRGLDTAVIDEIQRAPELLLAIKESVDNDQRPGRFLLTGSANLMTLPKVADSLAGRMEVTKLLPLSQSEIFNTASTFLANVFKGSAPQLNPSKKNTTIIGDALIKTVLSGGYPEAIARASDSRRSDWYLNYIDAIIQRDIRDVAQIEQVNQVPQLLDALAHHASQLTNHSRIGALLGLPHNTTQKYTDVLEQLFLVHTLPSWHSNQLKRLIKAPKLQFLDSGLLASRQGISFDEVQKERIRLGPLLETFVFSEILKLASWNQQRFEFFHFRDKQQNEVDIIVKNNRGQIVGIEVKSSATVTKADFAGLKKLAAAHPKEFVMGLVLYDHDQTIPFGEQLYAVPVSTLWH